MAVKIRCRKTGANNDPCFRIVATDKRWPRDGKALEILGWYDPKRAGANFSLKVDRVEHWVRNGAELSETVRSLIKRARKGGMAAPAAAPVPAVTPAEAPAQA
jgi:small subunit ribosomal protein S16